MIPEKPDDYNGHHQPRKSDKRKKRRQGIAEDNQDRRASRINFKRYVQELEEEMLDEEMDDTF